MLYKGKEYDERHGGPFDRGAADSYYQRGRNPHYFVGDTYSTPERKAKPGTSEYEAYMAGFDYNEELGDHKDWS